MLEELPHSYLSEQALMNNGSLTGTHQVILQNDDLSEMLSSQDLDSKTAV